MSLPPTPRRAAAPKPACGPPTRVRITVNATVPSERSSRRSVSSLPSRVKPTSSSPEDVSRRMATTHGPCPQEPPVATHSARRIAATTRSPRPVATTPAVAAPSTRATSATSATYSTAACPRIARTRRSWVARRFGGPGVGHEPALGDPAAADEVAKDDAVAPTRRDHLPVAPAQRLLGPPAVFDQPRLADGVDDAAVDEQRAPVVSRAH